MNAIDVRSVVKNFKLYPDKGQTLKERLLFRTRRSYQEHLVLKGVSFSLEKGEAVGIVGENGSGKSTLLKLMSRIIVPDGGEINVVGRVSALIELGAGFHADMSGRENIYINAAIFGLTKKEIDSRLQDIIDFSELHAFIDSPVRTYSSGMYMRLAFSVAIHVNADVLLIDEILAVGDAAFQQKCFERLREIKRNGTTIIIVSHSLGQIEQICDRSIWLHDGEIRMEGMPKEVHAHYLAYMARKGSAQAADARPDASRIETVGLYDGEEPKTLFWTGEPVMVRVGMNLPGDETVMLQISLQDNAGQVLCVKNTLCPKGTTLAVLSLYDMPLLHGDYGINAGLYTPEGAPIDRRDGIALLSVTSAADEQGLVHIPSSWEFQ